MEWGLCVIDQPNRDKGGKHSQQLRRGVGDQERVVDQQMPLLHPTPSALKSIAFFHDLPPLPRILGNAY